MVAVQAQLEAQIVQLHREAGSLKMSLEIVRKNRDEWERAWGVVVQERDQLRQKLADIEQENYDRMAEKPQ